MASRSVAARLLGLRVRISPGAWQSVVSVVCCLVEVSATGWSLLQRSATECGVSGRDCEAAYASVVYVYSSCTTCLSIRLEYNSQCVGLRGLGCEGQ